MDAKESPETSQSSGNWITGPVLGIVLATFFSDFGHEACTAVLPLYLTIVGLGPEALGVIEGVADFLVSLSKLGGGVLGHRVRHKRPWAAAGYAITAVCTACIGLVKQASAAVALRSAAWVARGYRGPLRDAMLAEAVPQSHYGRAFGLERTGDMLGAVSGPLIAALLVWAGVAFGHVILLTLIPGLAAAAAFFFLTRDQADSPVPTTSLPRTAAAFSFPTRDQADSPAPTDPSEPLPRPAFPKLYWQFLGGVFLFGMGDFSRAFLILLAARALGEEGQPAGGTLSLAVLLYALHNLISAAAAYAIGERADRTDKLRLLVVGYGLGVATNVLLALYAGTLAGIFAAVVLSAIYLAAEQTLEKATAAHFLPKELRSLGFGILAASNAIGDMASSLMVGYLLKLERPELAFGVAAAFGLAGVVWLSVVASRRPAQA